MNKMAAKLTVLAVATALAAGSALTGCGKKNVDYTLDDGNSGGDGSGGSLSDRLGIPESYSGTIDGIDEATGLTKVTIDASEISVPGSDKMSTVYVESKTYTNEDKKRVCESFFDVSAGIYQYDPEHPYKGDVEKQIEYWEQVAQNAESDEEKSSYDEIVQSYKDQLKDATDEREGAGDYSADAFIGQVGENEFLVGFYGADGEDVGAGFYIQYSGSSMLSYRPKEGAADASNYTMSGGSQDGTNTASITKEEAEQKALDFLLSCGVTDVVNTVTQDIWWDYYDSNYSSIATEACGYSVHFERSIDGGSSYPYSAYTWNVDGMGGDDQYVYYGSQNEAFEICVDDNGIYQASCFDNFNVLKDKTTDADVITWNEALEALPKAINTWYADGSSYSTISFNDVRLTYYLMADGDGYKYVPVWVFAECETYDGVTDSDYPIHLIILDATTGEFISLKDVQAAMGVTGDADDSDDSDDGGTETTAAEATVAEEE